LDIASAPLLGRYLADEDEVSEVLLQLFSRGGNRDRTDSRWFRWGIESWS